MQHGEQTDGRRPRARRRPHTGGARAASERRGGCAAQKYERGTTGSASRGARGPAQAAQSVGGAGPSQTAVGWVRQPCSQPSVGGTLQKGKRGMRSLDLHITPVARQERWASSSRAVAPTNVIAGARVRSVTARSGGMWAFAPSTS